MTAPSSAPAEEGTRDIQPMGGIRFTVASRPQRRYTALQTVSNLTGTSFQPIPLTATGWLRKISLFFTAATTAASAGAIVAGDGPWNLIAGITLTDATGQPVFQPISGYNLYLKNKYSNVGAVDSNTANPWGNPHLGPEFNFASSATVGAAVFRLDIDLEQDRNTGYGCIPNLDSNASLQLKIDVSAYTVAFTGTGVSVATLQCRITQWYWAPIGTTVNGVPAQNMPVGSGDYLETRYETGTASASTENLLPLTNRGGMIKNIILVSRAAGVRTAFTAGTPIGFVVDNNPKDEGVLLEEHLDWLRRVYGYLGTDLTTAYTPVTAGTLPGLDRGVMVWPFFAESGGRDSWLNTRVGSLVQFRLTPGASATSWEALTELMQVRDTSAFFSSSALI